MVDTHEDVAKLPVPDTISSNPQKMALWNFVCSDMAHRKMLNTTYLLIIRELVETVFQLDEYRELLEEEGPTQPLYDKYGNQAGTKANPLFAMVNRLQGTLVVLLQKVGMTPRDIHYLSNPDATSLEPIQAVVHERQAITYFR